MHDMHNTAAGSFSAWLDHDPELVREDLARHFPGVPSWHGEWTGSWWAMVGDRLLEASCPFTLADLIRTALAAVAPRPATPSSPSPPAQVVFPPRPAPSARPGSPPRLGSPPRPGVGARPRSRSSGRPRPAALPAPRPRPVSRHAAGRRPGRFLDRVRALLHIPAPVR